MRRNFKILLGIITFTCLFSLANFKQNNAHAFVHSKQEIQKNSEIFEAADYSASMTTNAANKYAENHFIDDKAKNYIYNLFKNNAAYLTKNYEFYDELGQSYFYNDTHESDTGKFTNYYQYAKYAADLIINRTLKTQHHFKFSIKHRSSNDYFSYSKWEKGYINPKWMYYSYSSEADGYNNVPLYNSLYQANKAIKEHEKYYNAKKNLNFDGNAKQMLSSFSVKKKTANVFMLNMDNKLYYVPKTLYSNNNKSFTIFEKYNTYADKNIIWSSIDIKNQRNIDMMIFNKNAKLNNQRIWNMSNGNIYYKYHNNMWQAYSLTYD